MAVGSSWSTSTVRVADFTWSDRFTELIDTNWLVMANTAMSGSSGGLLDADGAGDGERAGDGGDVEPGEPVGDGAGHRGPHGARRGDGPDRRDRKSTRLNSSHSQIS